MLAQCGGQGLLFARVGEAAQEAVVPEHGQAWIVERDQAHQRVAVVALAADLVGVHAGGLVAVVPVRDQQLGVREAGGHGLDHIGVGHAPDAVAGAIGVGRLAPGLAQGRLQQAPGVAGVEAEDGGEVVLGGAGQLQAILLGTRLGALVRADQARAVLGHANAGEKAPAGVVVAVGPAVGLLERPDRRLAVLGEDALVAPGVQGPRRVLVAVAAAKVLGEVQLDGVVLRAVDQRAAHRRVDHVVRRCQQVVELAGFAEVVVERAQGLDFRHRGRRLLGPIKFSLLAAS